MSTIERPLDPPQDPPGEAERPSNARTPLYRAVWRWHFYAGLLVIPVVVLLCLSGLVYLFKPQIHGLMYGHLRTVTPAERVVTYAEQRKAVETTYPGASVTSIFTPVDAKHSTQFDITTAAGKDLSVYVNPYTGQVLGQRDNGKDIVKIALALHGSLMTGGWLGNEKIGDYFIEIVAGWTIVLLVTGVYLWWPRGRRKGLRGVLLPRFHLRGKRILWRDVHAVTGVLFAFVTLFFLITGMAWTGFWGVKFSEVSDKFNLGNHGAFAGASSQTVGEKLPNGQSPWALGNLPLPVSDTAHREHQGHGATGGELRWDPRAGAPLDAIVAKAQQLGFPNGFTVFPPSDPAGSYMIGYWEDGDMQPNRSSTDQRTAYLDQYTGALISDYTFDGYGPIGKASSFGIALHEGRQWGVVSQILAALGALAILVSVASSIVMWRKRRPKGLGAPRKEPNRKIGFGVLVIVVVLGALFPLLGLSMLVIATIEFLLLRRVPPVARALGAESAREKVSR